METEGPEIENSARIISTEFQDMKFIKYYLKEAVDKYINYVKRNLEEVE